MSVQITSWISDFWKKILEWIKNHTTTTTTTPATTTTTTPVTTSTTTLTPPSGIPYISFIGGEESIGTSGRIPTIAVDSRNQPHIVYDGSSFAYLYDKISGVWESSTWNAATVGSSQYYNPHLEIDAKDRGWCSGVLIRNTVGLGILVRENMVTAPTSPAYTNVRIRNDWDQGNLSLDPKYVNEMVCMSAEGQWKKYVYDDAQPGHIRYVELGAMFAGHGGEKNVFNIAKQISVWHAAIGGWDQWSSSYRNSLMSAPVTWADYATYPSQSSDMSYVSVQPDNADGKKAYMIGEYAGVVMNIWDGTKMVFPSNAALVLDPKGTSGQSRFAVQMAPAKFGGVFACWSSGGNVVVRYVSPTGKMGDTKVIGAGTRAAMCMDSSGDLHITYVNGQPKYRKLVVAYS
jgi:hypothetical protein